MTHAEVKAHILTLLRSEPQNSFWRLQRILRFLTFLPALQGVLLAADVQQVDLFTPAEQATWTAILQGRSVYFDAAAPSKTRELRTGFLTQLLEAGATNPIVKSKGIFVSNAVFTEEIKLRYADVEPEVSLTHCHFLKDVDLFFCNFKRRLGLERSVFYEKANFEGLGVGGNLIAKKAKFMSVNEVSFHMARIGGGFDVSFVTFEGGVNLNFVQVNYWFSASSAVFPRRDSAFSLMRMRVQENADLSSIAFPSGLWLKGAQFDTITISNSTLCGAPRIDGIRYRIIEAGHTNPIPRGQNLFAITSARSLLDRSVFAPEAYGDLVKYQESVADRASAASTFVASKRRERHQLSFGRWVWSCFLDLTIGYGRFPSRIGLWSMFIVFIGRLVFRDQGQMVRLKPDDPGPPYNAWIYSLDLFLPVLNLYMEYAWIPRPQNVWAWRFLRFQVLSGWILVSLLVAALTGLVK